MTAAFRKQCCQIGRSSGGMFACCTHALDCNRTTWRNSHRPAAPDPLHAGRRIMPRHRYLQVVRAEALHPLRLNHYKMSDEQFVKQAARTSMSHFESFQSHFAERLALRQRR